MIKTLVGSARTGDSGGLPVLTKLARDAHPAFGRAGVADRHVCLFPLLGFSINTLSLLVWCWRLAWWSTMRSWLWKQWNATFTRGICPKGSNAQGDARDHGSRDRGRPGAGRCLCARPHFIPGITGRLYQQFAVTIAVSVMISAFNALTLSPALCALLLRPRRREQRAAGKVLRWFNQILVEPLTYMSKLRHSSFAAVGIALIVVFGGAAFLFAKKIPTSFLPDEDQGFFYVNLQLPNAASLQRTDEVCRKIENSVSRTPGVSHVTTTIGSSLLSGVQSTYSGFFSSRSPHGKSANNVTRIYQGIKARLNRELSQLPEAIAFAFSPPAIPGAGASGDITFVLEDRSGGDAELLSNNVDTFLSAARKRPELAQISTTFQPIVPQTYVDVDLEKTLNQGIAISDVYQTVQTFMGGSFINYFNRFGRQWQVYVQAEGKYRTDTQNLGEFYVRNSQNQMVPLSAVTRIERRSGPEFTMRYNLYGSAQINAAIAPGYTSDQAMRALEAVFEETMPLEMGYDYLGMSFQEKQTQQGVSPAAIFGFSLLFVFLILAALYESWSLPFSVLFSTPIAVFGAFGMLYLRRAATGRLCLPFWSRLKIIFLRRSGWL